MDRIASRLGLFLLGAAIAATPAALLAQNGTWDGGTLGVWSNSGDWQGGTIANGAGNTASFTATDVDTVEMFNSFGDTFFRNGVDLNSSRTLGHLVFSDSNPATGGGYEVFTSTPNSTFSGTTLTLSDGASSPTITVNPLGPFDTSTLSGATPTIVDDVIFRPYLSGTNGFTKLGGGVLTLAGEADGANSVGNNLKGVVEIAEGTLRIAETFSYYDFTNLVEPAAQSIDAFNLQDGGTLDLGNNVFASRVTSSPGATVNVVGGTGSVINNFSPAAGTTLNLHVENRGDGDSEFTADTFTAQGDWAPDETGGFDTINLSGVAGDMGETTIFRVRPNVNSNAFFMDSFAQTVINLDTITTIVRTNSFGNDFPIGEVHGQASSNISGGVAIGGVARYHIGGLNTDSTHAGRITSGTGGLDLYKEGTGTLTLSGSLEYRPVNNEEGTPPDRGQAVQPDRRGGITTVVAGTLALTGDAQLPAGRNDVGTSTNLGLLYSTVDIQAGATLDVSGTTGNSTAALQQVIGAGTIAGNYVHGDGRLAPADDNVGTSATLTHIGGAINFANNLTINGGEILYDVDTSVGGTNDLIQVAGSTTVGGSVEVNPTFLDSIPTSGQYTLLTSAGGISGSLAGWSVAWPGRGADPVVTQSGNSLVFNAIPVSGANIVWTGSVNSDWDVETTSNFTNGGSPDQFFDGDIVTFNGGGPSTVNISEDIKPSEIIVSSGSYTFEGPGAITGFATLTKNGGGTLTIARNNTYNGPTVINGGVVDIQGNLGALGTGAITLNGGTIVTNAAQLAPITNSQLVVVGTGNSIIFNGLLTTPLNDPVATPSLAGAGELLLTTEEEPGRIADLGNDSTAFTGVLSIAPTGLATTFNVRIPAGVGFGMPNGTLDLADGVTMLSRRNTSAVTEIGALTGEEGSTIGGWAGGGTAPTVNLQLGAANVSVATFEGAVVDSGSEEAPIPTNIFKVGSGVQNLFGENTFTGNVTVEEGTLAFDSATLADTSTVSLFTGGVLGLMHGVTDVVDMLFIDGAPAAVGTWGGAGSGAANISSLFTGSGILDVTSTFVLAGDYNNNGVVDAADFTVWRDNLNTATVLDNDPIGGTIGTAQYDQWVNNFGNVLPNFSVATAVPEPGSLAGLALLIASSLAGVRRRS
ncbi:Autotransporter-associated beta strand repeat protein [Pseudobythopirellula maris]|uniref:Autotransporter-associated beta strand repeat protein n=1 Tax=Pseudobythopirellula maris TaxID=2527991 RepID=A0A5C5ZV30_9BACT|nr:autotransporter-associated beta strand repeat-containing protein [Pseudobythopirellula maris]TWT90857.1 Autotransporter-associated beta strand repeat protein [Pseudobythopirellula maris]